MRDSPDLYPLCLAARLLGGAGAEVSPDSEKEKPGFMFGAVIVILCSAAHLVTTLWPAANEAELYNHWLLTALPLFSLFWDWSGRQPSQTWCTAVLKVEFLARKVSTGYRTNTAILGQKLAFSCNIWGYHLTRGYQFLSYVYLCRQIATDRLKESNIIS